MSHFSSVGTKIVREDWLIAAIQEVGSPVVRCEKNGLVRGYSNTVVEAKVVAVLDGNYDLGFMNVNGEFVAIGDFALGKCGGGSKQLSEVLQRIVVNYKKRETLELASQQRGLSGANIRVSIRSDS